MNCRAVSSLDKVSAVLWHQAFAPAAFKFQRLSLPPGKSEWPWRASIFQIHFLVPGWAKWYGSKRAYI
jgi:hypothetical protein